MTASTSRNKSWSSTSSTRFALVLSPRSRGAKPPVETFSFRSEFVVAKIAFPLYPKRGSLLPPHGRGLGSERPSGQRQSVPLVRGISQGARWVVVGASL